MRAYVQPPSVSKKGFNKTGWRTFILSRMSNVEISNQTFDSKRPQYKEGSDNSMSVTYVTSDWTKQPKVKKEKKPVQPTPQPTEPTVTPEKPTTTVTKPEIKAEPEKQELPQPKPEVKPEPIQKEPETSEPEKEELPQPKPEEKPSKNPEGEEEDKNLQESLRKIKRLMFS